MMAVVLAAPSAQAGTQVIDADNAAFDNQDISTFFPGVTLAAISPNSDVYAVPAGFAGLPARVFGYGPGDGCWTFPGDPYFTATFASPVQKVTLGFTADGGGTMYAYADAAQTVLLASDTESFGHFSIAVGGNLISSIAVKLTQGIGFDFCDLYHLVLTTASPELQIGYAANLGGADSFFNLTNAGSNGGADPAGDICANVYVFDPAQELIACCSCPLTPNHLSTLSALNDLTVNPLTKAGVPPAITVAFVASTACDASAVTFGNAVSGLAGWNTTVHEFPSGAYALTEMKLQTAPLSASELQKMTTQCLAIETNASGAGICNVCHDGAQGAAKQ